MTTDKSFILIVFLFSLASLSSAKPPVSNSTQTYHYWAERGIVEMVHAHMSDHIETIGEEKSIVEIVTRKKYEVQFLKNINDSLPNLSQVAHFLQSNDWVGLEISIFRPLLNNLKEKHPLNAGFFKFPASPNSHLLTNVGGKTNRSAYWNKKEIEILEAYERDLALLATPTAVAAENIFEFDDAPNFTLSTKGVFISVSILIVGMLFGGWLVFFYSKHKIYSILEEERVYYLDYPPLKSEKSIFHFITLFHVLKRRKDSYKRHNAEMKKKLEQLEFENSETRD